MRRPIICWAFRFPKSGAGSRGVMRGNMPGRSASPPWEAGCRPPARPAEPWPRAGTKLPSGNLTVGAPGCALALAPPTLAAIAARPNCLRMRLIIVDLQYRPPSLTLRRASSSPRRDHIRHDQESARRHQDTASAQFPHRPELIGAMERLGL